MKKIILLILIVIVIIPIGKSIYDYYYLKSSKGKLTNLAFFMFNTNEGYFGLRGRNPKDSNEYLEYLCNMYRINNGEDLRKDLPEIITKKGLFIDEYDDKIVFYTSNRKNIKKYKTEDYIWDLDSISYFDYVFKPIKIALVESIKWDMCGNYQRKEIKLYKNTYRVFNRNIISKVYNVIKDVDYYKKGKSSNFFYLYGKLVNKKYLFSILCNDSSYNYNNLVIYADSIYNKMRITQEADEIYIPFNYCRH